MLDDMTAPRTELRPMTELARLAGVPRSTLHYWMGREWLAVTAIRKGRARYCFHSTLVDVEIARQRANVARSLRVKKMWLGRTCNLDL